MKKNVQVDSMYMKNGDYYVWAEGRVLKYGNNRVWSLDKKQNYVQICNNHPYGINRSKFSLSNMLKKIL